MNVHDEYRCTATYPFTCDAPVAYLVEYTCEGDAFAPADRYTCQGHADQARKGDVLCSRGGCGRMGEAYPAAEIVDGSPFCRRHAVTARHKGMLRDFTYGPVCGHLIGELECGEPATHEVRTSDTVWVSSGRYPSCESHGVTDYLETFRMGGVTLVRLADGSEVSWVDARAFELGILV